MLFTLDAVLESYDRGYCMLAVGQWFGEVTGKGVQEHPRRKRMRK